MTDCLHSGQTTTGQYYTEPTFKFMTPCHQAETVTKVVTQEYSQVAKLFDRPSYVFVLLRERLGVDIIVVMQQNS